MTELACEHCAFRDDLPGGLFNCDCPSKKVNKCYYAHKMSDQIWLAYHASILRGDTQMELFASNAELSGQASRESEVTNV